MNKREVEREYRDRSFPVARKTSRVSPASPDNQTGTGFYTTGAGAPDDGTTGSFSCSFSDVLVVIIY
jgi:hypothetical protein